MCFASREHEMPLSPRSSKTDGKEFVSSLCGFMQFSLRPAAPAGAVLDEFLALAARRNEKIVEKSKKTVNRGGGLLMEEPVAITSSLHQFSQNWPDSRVRIPPKETQPWHAK
jgi:hypothetical protein